MKNHFLPDPRTHPRLYAREYLRLRPVADAFCLALALLIGCPLALAGGWAVISFLFAL